MQKTKKILNLINKSAKILSSFALCLATFGSAFIVANAAVDTTLHTFNDSDWSVGFAYNGNFTDGYLKKEQISSIGSGITADESLGNGQIVYHIPTTLNEDAYLTFDNAWTYTNTDTLETKQYDIKLYVWRSDSKDEGIVYAASDSDDIPGMISFSSYNRWNKDQGISSSDDCYINSEWHFYEHDSDNEVNVGGLMYFTDLDNGEGYSVLQADTSTYFAHETNTLKPHDGYILGTKGNKSEKSSELYVTFKSSAEKPLQLSYHSLSMASSVKTNNQKITYQIIGNVPDGSPSSKTIAVSKYVNTENVSSSLFKAWESSSYEFNGWYEDSNLKGETYFGSQSMTSDVTVYGEFAKINENLSIINSADKDSCNVGDTINYTITVRQSYDGAVAQNFTVSEVIPNGFTLAGTPTIDGTNGTTSISGGNVTITLSKLSYGQTATIHLSMIANQQAAGQNVSATAIVTDGQGISSSSTAEVKVLQPNLSVKVNSEQTSYAPGDTISYAITVNQIEEGTTAQNVVISGSLPEELGLASITSERGTVSYNGNSFTITCGNLNFNDPFTVNVRCKAVNQNENIAIKTSISGDNVSTKENTYNISVRNPIMDIQMDTDSQSYSHNDTVIYTIQVRNLKENPTAYNVLVEDTLPDGLFIDSVEENGANGAISVDGNNFNVKYNVFAYNDFSTITVKAHVNISNNATLKNTVYISGDHISKISDYAQINVKKPVLSVTQKTDKNSYSVNDQIVYTITLKQTQEDNSAKNVVLSETLPNSVSLQNIDISGTDGNLSVDGNKYSIAFNSLDFGKTATIKVNALAANSDNDVTSNVNVTSDDANSVNCASKISINSPKLSVQNIANQPTACVGSEAEYTVTVKQDEENSTAESISVTEEFPSNIELLDVSNEGISGEINSDKNSFTATYNSLAYSEKITLNIKAKILDNYSEDSLISEATATASNTESVSSSSTINITPSELGVVIQSDEDNYSVDDEFAYDVSVVQTEPDSIAYNVVITDTLPKGLILSSDPVLEGVDGEINVDDNKITITIPELSYEDAALFSVKVSANSSLDGKSVVNSVLAEADDIESISESLSIQIGEKTNNSNPGVNVKILIISILIAIIVIGLVLYDYFRKKLKK